MENESESELDKNGLETELPTKGLEIIKSEVEKNFSQLVEIRHTIHENPELGFQEFETAKLVKQKLSQLGIEILGENIGKTGIVALVKGKDGGKTVALRADMDALPIQEKTDLAFASTKETIMHACGHDIHTTSLLGAAGALKTLANKNELNGDVVLIFQPNEERTDAKRQSGAIQIIKFLQEKGLREKISAIFGVHAIASMPRGVVKLPNEIALAGSSSFQLNIESSGGHVMNSWEKPNIEKLISVIEAKLAEKYSDLLPKDEAPKIIFEPTTHEIDSKAANVLSTKAKVGWTLRIILPGEQFKAKRQEIFQDIREITKQIVSPWEEKGAKYKIDVQLGTRPLTMRDASLIKLSRSVANKTVPNYKLDTEPLLAGEDMSYYFEPLAGISIPGTMALLGAASPEKGIGPVDHHRSDTVFDEEVIKDCSIYLSEVARRSLSI